MNTVKNKGKNKTDHRSKWPVILGILGLIVILSLIVTPLLNNGATTTAPSTAGTSNNSSP